jgi:type II secretory pathway component PulJ
MRRREAGLTLIEIMISSAIMVVMMGLAWRTIGNTGDVKRTFEAFEERNHELRMAMGRIVADFQAAYLSRNEDLNATSPRTLFLVKSGSRLPEVRFSTLGHRALWADANESEQTVISYVSRSDPERPGVTDWVRREQRRLSNELPADEPAEYDVVLRDVSSVEIELWNWKSLDWQDSWDTTQSDAQRGWLPSRARITIVIKDADGKEYKITSQARILMQEPVERRQ